MKIYFKIEVKYDTRKNAEYIYAEVYCYLNYLGETYNEKIPKNVFEAIENERDSSVCFNIDDSTKLEEILSIESLSPLAALDYEFWCTPEENKEQEKNQGR